MSEADTGEAPIESKRHLRPYGVGGDYIGARRARRAFRLIVIACLGITVSLYFAEHYLRYDLSEVQYRMALTLEDDSQRAILRNVVERDRRESEFPTAKYVAALAYIEEDDVVLERYAQAIELAPEDSALMIVYGCKLFHLGDYKEARRVFNEAGLKAAKNALPGYLEAAAIAASSTTEEDYRTAVALVARTNDRGDPLIFPSPEWHESLPKDGYWYANLRQEMAVLCCEPLFSLKNVILKRVKEELREGAAPGVETWLFQLQVLGTRLIGSPTDLPEYASSSATIAGLKTQLDAIAQRQEMAKDRPGTLDPSMVELVAKLQDGLTRISKFETDRELWIQRDKRRALRPVNMAFCGGLFLGAASLVFLLLNRIVHSDRNARVVRHTRVGVGILFAWIVILGLCLACVPLGPAGPFAGVMGIAFWSFLLVAIVVLASVYPAFLLPAPATLCHDFQSEPDYNNLLHEAHRTRRRAYFSLAGRFLNIALGLYLCLLCFWVLGFRVFSGLYPTDLKLLVSGYSGEELSLIRTIQALL